MVAPAQTVVSTATSSSATAVATLGSTSTSGNTLFAFTWNDSGLAVTSVTDDATPTNTYVEVSAVSGATSYGPSNASLWVATSFRPAKNITANWSAAPSNEAIMAAEYPGNWTFSAANNATNAAEPPDPDSGAFSNPAAGDLLLGPIAGFQNPGSSWTSRLYSGPGLWQDKTASTASSSNHATGTPGFDGWIIIGASFTSASAPAPANTIFFNTD
jgi:hypothetical protein